MPCAYVYILFLFPRGLDEKEKTESHGLRIRGSFSFLIHALIITYCTKQWSKILFSRFYNRTFQPKT